MSVALTAYLKPLEKYLNQKGVSEICINKPGEVWVEKQGAFHRFEDSALSKERLAFLADLVAESNHKDLSSDKPWLSASLPTGERCQFVLPPACDLNQFVCSIRKPSILDLSLDDWEKNGAFDYVKKLESAKKNKLYTELKEAYSNEQYKKVVELAVKGKLNVIISGGTSSAKTTFLNSCLKHVSHHERLITIEGVREVRVHQPNVAHLVANEDTQDSAITMLELLKTSLRLRPDRIFVSEIRDKEAYPFLRACISGHPGSLTTLHADNIAHAKHQLCFMLGQSPELQGADEKRLRGIINSAVGLFIQMTKHERDNRVIEDIELNKELV